MERHGGDQKVPGSFMEGPGAALGVGLGMWPGSGVGHRASSHVGAQEGCGPCQVLLELPFRA